MYKRNRIYINKIIIQLMASHLVRRDSVTNLLVIQSLIKQTITYKSKLLTS